MYQVTFELKFPPDPSSKQKGFHIYETWSGNMSAKERLAELNRIIEDVKEHSHPLSAELIVFKHKKYYEEIHEKPTDLQPTPNGRSC